VSGGVADCLVLALKTPGRIFPWFYLLALLQHGLTVILHPFLLLGFAPLSGLCSALFQDPVPLFKVYAEELVSQLKEQALQKQ